MSEPIRFDRVHRIRSRRALLGLTAVLALLLAGCTSGPGGSENTAGESVTLTYMVWETPQLETMQKLADQFHAENPNITVNVQLTPWEQYWTKLQTSVPGGSAPDVFWMNIPNFEFYAQGGALLPISDQVARDNVDMSNYVSAIADAYKWDNQIYALPKDVDAVGLWYNKKLFTDAGVEFPDASWTWADVTAAAQKLTDPSTGVYGIAADLAEQQNYYNTILQAGGYIISPDGKSSGYDSPEAISGLQFWVDLINKYHASPTLEQMTDTAAEAMFNSGTVAMFYGGSWSVLAMVDNPYTKENADVAPMPMGEQVGGVSNGLGNVIYAQTKHPDEAWQFVKFLGSKEAADIQAATGAVIPAYKGTTDAWVEATPEFHLQAFVDELAYTSTYPSSLNTAVWSDFALKEFALAWTGQESVEDAAKNVADEMNADLAKESQ